MKHYIFSSVFLLGVAIMPFTTQAYEVTDRQMTRVSDTVTMYTLEFKFGFLNADMWMPFAANKTIDSGNETTSVVLSTAPIKDNKYFVPMKSNGIFTLLVLEQHEVGKSKNSVTVNKLPITIQREGEEKVIRTFEGEELKDFTVPKQ